MGGKRQFSVVWFAASACLAGSMLVGSAQFAWSQPKEIVREKPTPATGKKSLALLVGVQDYDRLPRLQFCHADVTLLEKTLRDYGGFDTIVTMTEEAEEKRYRPTKGNLISELDLWLKVANSGEYNRVLIYFSGHGFLDKEKRLYFAPPDCHKGQLALTGLPMSYVRQMLDACDRVPVKLLLLDTCHAGETKGDGEGVAGDTVAAAFQKASGVYTIASCSRDEVSLEWPAKKHGLFTYWLCQGIQGQADGDGDKQVDTGELYKYIYGNVLKTSASLGREQNVVARPSDDWRGVAVLSQVREVRLKLPVPDEMQTVAVNNAAKSQGAVLYLRYGDRRQHQLQIQPTRRQLVTLPLGEAVWYYCGNSAVGENGWKSIQPPAKGEIDFVVDGSGSKTLWRPIPVLIDKAGLKLVHIPADRYPFRLGSRESARDVQFAFGERESFEDEHPIRQVRFSKSFYMGAHEVTAAQFRQFVTETRYRTEAERDGRGATGFKPKASEVSDDRRRLTDWRNPEHHNYDENHPVTIVTRSDALAFCEWLTKKHGVKYRLPTEAEWEFAARGGTNTRFWCGNDPESLITAANVPDRNYKEFEERQNGRPLGYSTLNGRDGYVHTAPVGSFKPNPFGLYDMHGNVWEYCKDGYHAKAYTLKQNLDPLVAASADLYVMRGGCFM